MVTIKCPMCGESIEINRNHKYCKGCSWVLDRMSRKEADIYRKNVYGKHSENKEGVAWARFGWEVGSNKLNLIDIDTNKGPLQIKDETQPKICKLCKKTILCAHPNQKYHISCIKMHRSEYQSIYQHERFIKQQKRKKKGNCECI